VCSTEYSRCTDLGITKTHSRPHVSNDNAFSEAGFKTLKYRPNFPARFGCIEDARSYCVDFFAAHSRGVNSGEPSSERLAQDPHLLCDCA